jgi:hypothetical protein
MIAFTKDINTYNFSDEKLILFPKGFALLRTSKIKDVEKYDVKKDEIIIVKGKEQIIKFFNFSLSFPFVHQYGKLTISKPIS